MLSGPIQVLMTPVPDDRLRFQVAYEKRCAWSTETLFFFLARGTQRQFAPTYIENTFFIIIVMIIVITVNNHTTPHSHPRRQTILSTASHAKGTICNVNFQRNKALQYCCDIILNSSNIVPTLQRRFALLIIERCESSCATAPYLDHFHLEGGGIWMISEKNILQTDFEGKNVARKIANTVFIRISAQPRISAHLE